MPGKSRFNYNGLLSAAKVLPAFTPLQDRFAPSGFCKQSSDIAGATLRILFKNLDMG
jgi:hypothetical protein